MQHSGMALCRAMLLGMVTVAATIACRGVLNRAYSCVAIPMRVRGSERCDDLEHDDGLAIQPTEFDAFTSLAT